MISDIELQFVRPTDPLKTVLRVIDASRGKLALVVDGERRLLGTVSDGDIRRAFLRGGSLDSTVSDVMNRDPVVMGSAADRGEVLRLMQARVIRHIPIVDDLGRVVALRSLEDLIAPSPRDNWVVIMAGGEGLRLRPLTDDCPKPMLRVGQRPILEIIIGNMKAMGFHRFFVSVNYRAQMVMDHFGDGSRFGIDVRYLQEDKPLGTAGPLALLSETPQTPVVVMNGDILTKLYLPSMVDFHTEHNAVATMGVREYETQIPFGVIDIDGMRITSITEKPVTRHLVSAGIYVLSPEALRLVPRDARYDMPEFFSDLYKKELLAVPFLVREYWTDIGHMDDLSRAKRDFQHIFPDG